MSRYGPMSVKKIQEKFLNSVCKIDSDPEPSDFLTSLDRIKLWNKVLNFAKCKPKNAGEVYDNDELTILSSDQVEEIMVEFNSLPKNVESSFCS
jgi:hypothetical protein